MEEVSYHRYPKRRRLKTKWYNQQHNLNLSEFEDSLNICELPTDVLYHIFRWIPCSALVIKVKLVSKYFQVIVNDYLSIKFFQMFPRLSNLYTRAADIFNNAEDIVIYKRMYNILSNTEVMIHEYKLLEATVFRYLRQRKSEFVFCYCFGRILDMFDFTFFRLYNMKGGFTRASKNARALNKLVKILKSFIFHFERRTEVNINTNCFVSGAKICDILDSCIFSERNVLYEKYENGMCNLKLRYVLPNAWFIAISIEGCLPKSKCGPSTWQEQQRLMYLRLRRLASSHTGHQMHLHHWEQAQQLVDLGMDPIPRVPNCVYNGFGEFENELFFYGNFNQGGYACKVRRMENRELEINESEKYKLEINVELTCPLEQAPVLIYKQHCMHIDQNTRRIILKRRSSRLEKAFHMRVQFKSIPIFDPSFLPLTYVYVVSEDKRLQLVDKHSRTK